MPELPNVGDEFAGYLLQSVIGRGAMSVVYEAEHPRFGNGIALKVLAAEVAADHIFRTRFLDESRIAASMNHPNVIPIYDVGESDGLLYIAMRRASGGDLRRKIAKHGPLPPQTAVALLGQATRALDAAHRMGIVHRDVKPENLLIEGGGGDSEHVYLADFGISRLGMERNGLTSTGKFLGTTDYVAPEQITEPYVYGSADQYSLGCVLYECLTGRVPFEKGPSAASTRPPLQADLPPAVSRMFGRVLAERPGDRYNTCREFMEAASAALADMATLPTAGVDSRTLPPEPAPVSHQPAPAIDQPRFVPAPAADQAKVVAPAPAADQPMFIPAPAIDQPTVASAAAIDQPTFVPAPAIDQPEIDPPQVASEPAETLREAAPAPAEYLLGPTYQAPAGAGDPAPGSGRRRWLVIAAVLLLIGAGGACAYAATSSQPKANASTPAVSAKPMPTPTPTSLLTRVLTAANASKIALGMLPSSSCKQKGTTTVVCTAPSPAIASTTFITYPTITALFAAYEAEVSSLNHGQYQQNVKDCGASAPSPYGEVAWNHDEQHSRAYTAAEMIAGKVPVTTAMGRMACLETAGHSEDIVWTTDYGKMLGIAIGSASNTAVWYWWIAVHHNIIFPGTPMDMGGKPVSLMSGAPMPTTSSSGAPMMSASASPKMSASAAPSMSKKAG